MLCAIRYSDFSFFAGFALAESVVDPEFLHRDFPSVRFDQVDPVIDEVPVGVKERPCQLNDPWPIVDVLHRSIVFLGQTRRLCVENKEHRIRFC